MYRFRCGFVDPGTEPFEFDVVDAVPERIVATPLVEVVGEQKAIVSELVQVFSNSADVPELEVVGLPLTIAVVDPIATAVKVLRLLLPVVYFAEDDGFGDARRHSEPRRKEETVRLEEFGDKVVVIHLFCSLKELRNRERQMNTGS